MLKGSNRALAEAGYDLTLYHIEYSDRHPERRQRLFEEFLQRKRVDAFIAVSLELRDEELARIRDLGKPLVGLGGPLPGVTTLSLDDRAVARLAASHLTALGHRRIAFIGGVEGPSFDFHLAERRRQGYEEALAEAGIALDARLRHTADFTIAGGYQATLQILGDPRLRPTAIFAVSDEMAIGAILAARDLGIRVPEGLSVIGIDGHELGDFFRLTTVDQHPVAQGRLAAEALLHELGSGGATSDHVDLELPYDLRVRKSTAVPPSRP